MPPAAPDDFPQKRRRLRLVARSRHVLLVALPLGAVVGFMVAVALRGLGAFEPLVDTWGRRTGVSLFLPAIGMVLTTLWLRGIRLGEVSLVRDMELARHDPYQAFPLGRSLSKVVACTLTIGFGASAGIEGPGRWFGGAFGLQYHRLLRHFSSKFSLFRQLTRPPLVLVRSGAAASMAAIFRAPISGALMATEQHGKIASDALPSCLLAAAASYVTFTGVMGHAPLFPLKTPWAFTLGFRDIGWSLVLGALCGALAWLLMASRDMLRRGLGWMPLPWRGLVAGLGLVLLALPAHCFWNDLHVTQGGGLELLERLLISGALPKEAAVFLALKLLATALTFAGGGVGGAWLPSLAMGAALGAGVDALAGREHTGYLALVGASAMAGGTHRMILAPVVFLAETTGMVSIVVPALVGTTVSFMVTREAA